ncbi:Protein of unknown function DUF1639 [Cynara cardunculus var. scolymus]|uniref:Uncharacterized protein n=2 Tax=Cynara cardunculus var. scolymus TaxID=59895 RepID=A0A103XRF4_CYNCS|nr:Protein of unknown function DUF1639 [Cynara cardunculus var. scolymus]
MHNFSLPFLKWGQRSHANTYNRCRRLLSDATTTNPHRRSSPATDSESDHNNNGKSLCSLDRKTKDKGTTVDDENGGVFLERENNSSKAAADGEVKPWNLRPRRSAISNVPNHRVLAASSMKSLRGVAAEEEEEDNNMKRKLWISLSKEEIEEDVYAFTGSKPARRAKKRNKTVQKQVDNLFPGLYLVGISADSYRV